MRLKNIFVMLFVAFSVTSFAQEHKSIHQLDYEKYEIKSRDYSNSLRKGVNIIPLNNQIKSGVSTTVFGYLPDWEYVGGSYKYLRYDLLTHIACFDFSTNKDGYISNPAGWPWTDLINKAHSNGVKVILTLVNFKKDEIRNILTNSTAKENVIKNTLAKLKAYKLDGVNVDFEGLYSADKTSRLESFLKALTDSVHAHFPNGEVSFAAPAVNWSGTWDFPGLAASCDYLFIMGYDFFGHFSSYSGPTAPLTGGTYNITNTVVTQYASVVSTHPEKLILGIPYFGEHYRTEGSEPNSRVKEFVSSPRFRSSQAQAQIYGRLWSDKYKTPWYRWNDGTWNQVWYDDDVSLGLKYDLADSKKLKGIGMWALGYDGERQELWNLLDIRYGSGIIPAPNTPTDFRVLANTDSTLRLRFEIPARATSFKICMSRDGEHFPDTASVVSNNVVVTGLSPDSAYFFKVAAVNSTGSSAFSEVLGGIPGDSANVKILVVNGFDRIGSTHNTFDLVKKYRVPFTTLGKKFASASNEAVFHGKVSLQDYDAVFWILMDESTADDTFNPIEESLVEKFLDAGGHFFVSGSEIGWDLGRSSSSSNDVYFYQNYLKADYINDAPEGDKGAYYSVEPISTGIFAGISTFNFDNGTHGTIDVDWPDAIKAINGAQSDLKFVNVSTTKGVAGISFHGHFPKGTLPGRMIYFSFPYEAVYPDSKRTEIMTKVFEFFDQPEGVRENGETVPKNFVLYQNYPNPFNPSTTISFYLPVEGKVTLKIFNVLGQIVYEKDFSDLNAGDYKFVWNGVNSQNVQVSSGTYIARLEFKNSNGFFVKNIKMMLIK